MAEHFCRSFVVQALSRPSQFSRHFAALRPEARAYESVDCRASAGSWPAARDNWVVAYLTASIAPKFTHYTRWRAIHSCRDLADRFSGLTKGKAHSALQAKSVRSIVPSQHLVQKVLHFVCEFGDSDSFGINEALENKRANAPIVSCAQNNQLSGWYDKDTAPRARLVVQSLIGRSGWTTGGDGV